jgi:hypothetical protein
MSNYTCNTIFSVTKAEHWKIAITAITSYNYNIYSIQEYQFENIISFLGKSKVIDSLMWFRNKENPSLYTNVLIESFYNWWKKDVYKIEKMEFLNVQTDLLLNYSKLNKNILMNNIRFSYDLFITWLLENHPKPNFNIDNLYYYIVSNMPFQLRKFLRNFNFFKNYFIKNNYNKINIFSKESILIFLKKEKIKFSIIEFNIIYKSLENFHK